MSLTDSHLLQSIKDIILESRKRVFRITNTALLNLLANW